MLAELGQQLIYAFANGAEGGNPSFVIATVGIRPNLEDRCIRIAREKACEVTHIHFDHAGGQAFLNFYVASGAIAFCGHGALAATAWAVATGWADSNLLLNYAEGQLQMLIEDDGYFGFVEPAGSWCELVLDQLLREQVADMLGLDALQAHGIRVWLGGRQRAKAMIALSSRSFLCHLQIEPDLRDQFCRQHAVTGIYPFASHDGMVAARHFPISSGFDEDMATGNIASTVAALVCGSIVKPITIAQGGPNCAISRLRLLPRENGLWFVGGRCRY